MAWKNLIKTDQNGRCTCLKYVLAALMLLLLVLIWPLSLLKITDPYINNRLLKQEGDYSYFYVSGGEYLTTVIKGKGAYVEKAAIRLRFQEQVPEDASLNAYMFDSQGSVVLDQHISIYPKPENDIYEISFDLELGKDSEYQFILAPESDFTVGVYCQQYTSEPAVYLQSTDLSLFELLKTVSMILQICVWICGLLFIAMLLVGDKIKNLKSGTDKLDACSIDVNKSFIIVPSLVSFLGLIIYGQYLFDYNSDSIKGLSVGIVLIIALTIMAFLCTFVRRYELIIAGFVIFIVGCIFLITFPEGMIPDEKNHFLRAFSLAFGNFQAIKISDTSVGGILPRALQEFNDPSVVIDFNDCDYYDFINTSLYSPICYLPQIIGIRVALLFTTHIHTVFMTARWFGFIGAFVLYMLALYLVPVGRNFMLVLMMLPMALQEMIGVTSDSMTNAFSFLFVAIVLRVIADNRKISTGKLAVITILGTFIGMCKLVYIPLWIIMFLIPYDLIKEGDGTLDAATAKKDVLKTRAKYAIMFGIPLLFCVVTNSILGKNLVPVSENVDAKAQIIYVLTHIPTMIMVVIRTIVTSTSQWFHEMTGDFLGGLNIRTLPAVTMILLLLIYISARDMKPAKAFSTTKAKWIFGITFFTGFFMILGTLYVSWTTVGYYIIRGIQGRYYIAMLPALGLFIGSMYSGKSMSSENDLIKCDGNNKSGIIVYLYILLIINMIVIVDVYKYLAVN